MAGVRERHVVEESDHGVDVGPHCLSRRGNSISLDPWAKKSGSRWQSAPHTQAIADESGTHSQRFQTPLHSGAQRLHRPLYMTTGVFKPL
jgi:hypothetical protein